MATTSTSTAVATAEQVFTEPERLALAGFLAGYTGLTREAYALDLRQYASWCQHNQLRLFQARRQADDRHGLGAPGPSAWPVRGRDRGTGDHRVRRDCLALPGPHPRAPCPASFRSPSAAPTWSWPPYTLVHGRLTAATLETVTFDRPQRIAFRLVRGPVPHITEEFALTEHDGTTRLEYSGELGTDFAGAGQWWAGRVAAAWEAAVRSSFTSIRAEAERRASPGTANP
jgi:hypothetical protein